MQCMVGPPHGNQVDGATSAGAAHHVLVAARYIDSNLSSPTGRLGQNNRNGLLSPQHDYAEFNTA